MSRRLFSTQIVDSDAFLDMPPTAQNLYFHLGMRADDDGFVGNPKKILRMVGGNDDDLKVLIMKRFVLAFESGVVVIKHWLIHNSIRKDRYNETQYLEEKSKIHIKENKSYTDDLSVGLPTGNQTATQVKLSKVKLSKDKTILPDKSGEYDTDFLKWYELYPRKVGKPKAHQAWKKIKPNTELKRKMVLAVLEHSKSRQWQKEDYIPYPATYLSQRRWEDTLPIDEE